MNNINTETIYKGTLSKDGDNYYLESADGSKSLQNYNIWEGYKTHWLGKNVCARFLEEKDYETDQNIIIMWPESPKSNTPFMELYYNERLVKYWASTFGHNAINVNGEFFNFSHLINENEVLDEAEYFYRPALGEFAPSPNNGMFEITEDGRAYYDKFGRNFMRTIHVLRVEGLDAVRLSQIYHDELDVIHNAPTDKKDQDKYRDFNFFTRSCTTIIRDGLRKYGFKNISGILPRELFESAVRYFKHHNELRHNIFIMPQLVVPEAPLSKMTPSLNPWNRWQNRKFK